MRYGQQATCHPDRKHLARGLCRSCYHKERYRLNPERGRQRQARYRERYPERVSATNKKWRAANLEHELARSREWHRTHREIRRLYSWTKQGIRITAEEYAQFLAEQDGRCGICRKVPNRRLNVDHNHETGVVRGLLCCYCNTKLHHIEQPDQRALAYLAQRPGDNRWSQGAIA